MDVDRAISSWYQFSQHRSGSTCAGSVSTDDIGVRDKQDTASSLFVSNTNVSTVSVQMTLVFETNRDEAVSRLFQGEERLLLLEGNAWIIHFPLGGSSFLSIAATV